MIKDEDTLESRWVVYCAENAEPLPGTPSAALIEESLMAGDTGIVRADLAGARWVRGSAALVYLALEPVI
jgi:hypothetical protein